ncbi:DUF2079 domain-containing protein [Prochlorococcus sp. MIT 1341]|uniref:DUF2079 domain-containing protein n=1 Tax=Prochlorococcus sp. MIT 1341 TaxID=3096221 RepID=UPI002A7600EE|nr:DUF2079 domain-containing protein [Prochlorococcus sp. MIT 1341]
MKINILPNSNKPSSKIVLLWIICFSIVIFTLQTWRIFSLNATYDQGLFLQEIWNTLQGRPFESTLASELSSPVKFEGELPELGYRHLAQHFTPLLAIWAPLVGLIGIWSLPFIQVAVIASAGWVLFLLGKEYLPEQLAGWIACSFFTTGTVLGPSLENFHDLCIIPLLVFSLILGISREQKLLYFIPALLLPLVREDVGLMTFSIGIWMVFRKPNWRVWGIGLCIYALTAVLIITNQIMPLFGSELSTRFIQERFGQYLNGETGGTIDVLISMAKQPGLLLKELISPIGSTVRLFVTLFLPLAFIPLLSIDVWFLIAVPLFVALSSQGGNAMSVHLRFMLYLVPGVFAGSIFWWSKKHHLFQVKRYQSIWKICMVIGIFFTLTGNPHRSLSVIIPDSIDPWVHIPIHKQLIRGVNAQNLFSLIPPDSSVAAETHLIPQLSERRILLRFPENYMYKDLNGKRKEVDYIISQPAYNADYSSAFRHHRIWVLRSNQTLEKLVNSKAYGVYYCDPYSIILRKDLQSLAKDKKCMATQLKKTMRKSLQ